MHEIDPVDYIVQRLETSPQPAALLGVGIPASGKTSFLRLVARQLDTTVVDVDAIFKRLHHERAGHFSLALLDHNVDVEASKQLTHDGIAIVDSTNCHVAVRMETITRMRAIGARTVGAAWLDTTLDAALARNAVRRTAVSPSDIGYMHRAIAQFPPTTTEGFSWVERIES